MNLGFALKNKIILCTFFIPLLFVYSCFNYQQYPDEWAPIQKASSDCGDISGSYISLAEKTKYKSKELNLKTPGPILIELFQVSSIDFYNKFGMLLWRID